MRRRAWSWRLVGASLLLSLCLNGVLVGSLVELTRRTPLVAVAPPPRERVTYLEVTPEPETAEVEPPAPTPEQPKPKPKPKLEFDELPEPEPEPEVEPEPEPEPEPQPEVSPPMELVLENLKMVEQPDELDEKDVPEDYDYLSNVNRDVQEQTRAELTNLEQDAVTPKASQLEPSPKPDPGTSAETEIAQNRQQPSAQAKTSPESPPAKSEQRPHQEDPRPQSLLAMRDLAHRDHAVAQDAHEELTTEAPDGSLQRARDRQASIAPQDAQARIDRHDPLYRFRPRPKDMDALFGKDALAPKRADGAHQSKTEGVWAQQRERYQSPLENMVPEVKVGNQTALRSRKHPFARYIAQMHRAIHDAWAWGFLEQLDTQSRSHPLNDENLWSRVEIVLHPDGRIDKVTTVRHSGKLAFDAAAREVVFSAGPFPDPPREIRSGNGKIYIHWAFHRDPRACGTFGAEPFILDNAGQGERPDPNVAVRAGRSEPESLGRRLHKPKPPAGPPGPALPPGGQAAAVPGPGASKPSEGPQSPGEGGSRGAAPGSESTSAEASSEDPEARKLANAWLQAFAAGDVDRLVARSSLPFYAGNTVAARTRTELRDLLATMVEEAAGAGRPKAAQMHTAAGLSKALGGLPAGVEAGQGRVYGLTKIGRDVVVLVLERKFGAWRVVGVAR